MPNTSRSSILFLDTITPDQAQAIASLGEILGRQLKPILLRDHRSTQKLQVQPAGMVLLVTDFDDIDAVGTTITPYISDILTVTCKDDASAAFIRRLMPFLPHVHLPLPETLEWATEKTKMRAKMRAFNKTTSPKFIIATDASLPTIKRIERVVGYPLIVKPSGLTSSLLITTCYYREELEQALAQIVNSPAIKHVKTSNQKPQILVEQLMEDGIYYSIDAYVGPRGAIRFTPPVYGKTGHDIGFDDYFGYLRMTPTLLTPRQVKQCEKVATAAIQALNLRSTSCHVELMHTEQGWKIIELGPRIGGFRHEMYQHAFGINHALNDLLNRIGLKPVVPKQALGYSVAMQFYPRNEGVLQRIDGLDAISKLPSIKRLNVLKHPGDNILFAKHGGSHVVEIVLFNPKRADLLADIRKIELNLNIRTYPDQSGTQLGQPRLTA